MIHPPAIPPYRREWTEWTWSWWRAELGIPRWGWWRVRNPALRRVSEGVLGYRLWTTCDVVACGIVTVRRYRWIEWGFMRDFPPGGVPPGGTDPEHLA